MEEPRWTLIRRIRREIRSGTYVTDEKLRAVVDRILRAIREAERSGQ